MQNMTGGGREGTWETAGHLGAEAVRGCQPAGRGDSSQPLVLGLGPALGSETQPLRPQCCSSAAGM